MKLGEIKSFLYLALVAFLTACGPNSMPETPCEAADRTVSLSVLIQNRLSHAYQACLSELRSEAVSIMVE